MDTIILYLKKSLHSKLFKGDTIILKKEMMKRNKPSVTRKMAIANQGMEALKNVKETKEFNGSDGSGEWKGFLRLEVKRRQHQRRHHKQ